MGDFARAEPLLLQDLEITKKAVRETHPEYSTVLNNLASVYVAMGTRDNSRKDLVRAEPLFRQALDIKRKVYGETHPSYAVGLKNLASFYVSLGAFDHNSKEFARAEPLLRQALEIERKTLAADHPANASGLHSLAYISMQIGDYGRAEPLYRQVLELEKKSHGEKHPKYIEDVSQLALLYHAMGDDTRALPLFRQVLDLQDVLTRDTSGSVGERQRLRMFADRRYFLDSLVSVILDSGGSPGEVYSRILDWKGVVSAGLADDRLSRDQPELAPILAELFQVRGRLANMAFESPVATQRTTWKRQFDELFTRKEGLEADLAARSATYRQSRQSPNPDQVSAALAEGSVLIDLFEYKYHSRAERGQLHPHCGSRLLACVVRPGRPVAVVSLGSTPPVEKAVREWRKAITEHRAEALRAASAELGKLVWEPLRPHLEGVRTALISPDGALTAFPFAALPGSRPGSYLIEDLAIGYVASGRQLVESRATSDTVGRGLLAVGGVDFQAEPGRPPAAPSPSFAMRMSGPVLTQRGGFVDLPGTAAEALAVRQAFSTAFPDQPAERLTGTRASETELKRRLDGGHVKVLHLATHGFFESPARVAVLRAHARAEGGLDLPDLGGKDADDSAAFALTPLLRSGVVLAGGGRKFEPEDLSADAPVRDDGILTAEEVQALDLRGCELVVLSACETGLGDLERGQGVMGLQRAFQAAGARAVVASLWKVDDTATAVLMERFYTHLWAEKLPRLEALRQAQLDVLRNPSLTTRRTQQSPRGISPTAEPLKSGGTVESTKSAMMGRCDPALWAAFLLSGDAS
jgi:CHAT domain-containing protein